MRLALPLRGCVTAAVLVLSSGITTAHAADTRFDRLSLLNAGDRVSLVFELTEEPQKVATRRVSAAVLELDAGPLVTPPKPISFMAPPGVRYVMGVSIQGGATGTRGVLRARITLLERARSSVRVVGRRVYVDFVADRAPVRTVPEPRTPRAIAPQPEEHAVTEDAPPPDAGSSAEPEPPAPPAGGLPGYQTAVQPAVERFEQLGPFLMSAAASPSESVLKAVGNTVTGIHGLLLSVDVPEESRESHALLLSAITAATKAVDPAFNGDRSAEARRAISLLEKVRAD